eukprot:jgi/Mesen1/5647/ME000286S04859
MGSRGRKNDSLIVEDDDEGFAPTKWKAPPKTAKSTPAAGRSSLLNAKSAKNGTSQAGQGPNSVLLDDFQVKSSDDYGYDPDSDNPLRRAELQELREIALQKSVDVTQSIRNVRKITEDTKAVASQTLVTLKEQGEQINRTHEKAVTMERELAKGEYLLNKLGPIFSLKWKVKKARNITGPKLLPNEKDEGHTGTPEATAKERGSLFGGKGKGKAAKGGEDGKQPAYDSLADNADPMSRLEDDALDEISLSLGQLKTMAHEMGAEMEKQDKQLDDLSGDISELNSRVDQSNKRGRRILGYRR